jgi:hypothetical protein
MLSALLNTIEDNMANEHLKGMLYSDILLTSNKDLVSTV